MTDEDESEGSEDAVERWSDVVQAMLAGSLRERDGHFLTRFVLIYQAIDKDGDPVSSFLTSNDLGLDDTAGMLHFATRSNDMAIDDKLRSWNPPE